MAFIDAHRHEVVEGGELGVELICRVLRKAGLQVASSSHYAVKSRPPSARSQRDAVMDPVIRQLGGQLAGLRRPQGVEGRPAAGYVIGRDQVARLMRAAGIEGVRRAKRVRTTRPDPAGARHRDLVQRAFTRHRTEPAIGHRPDLRADLGRGGLRLLHH